MAEIKTTARKFFQNGSATSSNIVGYTPSNSTSYVVRYTFSTDSLPQGASTLRLPVKTGTTDDWGLVGTLTAYRFKVTTSDTSHINANPTTDYDGNVGFTSYGGSYFLSIPKTSVILQPNTTYYLYIFPGEAKYGYFYNRDSTLELILEGAAGGVQIRDGGKVETFQPWIYTSGTWASYIPQVRDGGSWGV